MESYMIFTNLLYEHPYQLLFSAIDVKEKMHVYYK